MPNYWKSCHAQYFRSDINYKVTLHYVRGVLSIGQIQGLIIDMFYRYKTRLSIKRKELFRLLGLRFSINEILNTLSDCITVNVILFSHMRTPWKSRQFWWYYGAWSYACENIEWNFYFKWTYTVSCPPSRVYLHQYVIFVSTTHLMFQICTTTDLVTFLVTDRLASSVILGCDCCYRNVQAITPFLAIV